MNKKPAEDVSLEEKLRVLNGVIGTTQVSNWENTFLKSVVPVALARAKLGQVMGFTPAQHRVIDTVYENVA
jgi:hypothetical protein